MMLRYVLDCPELQACRRTQPIQLLYRAANTLSNYSIIDTPVVMSSNNLILNLAEYSSCDRVSISFIWTLAVRSSSSSDYLPKKEF